MSVHHLSHPARHAIQIECLACGAPRIVFDVAHGKTGECPRCNYLGWGYSDELDGSTRRLIMNGRLAVPQAPRRRGQDRRRTRAST